jgi:hypothetical protein
MFARAMCPPTMAARSEYLQKVCPRRGGGYSWINLRSARVGLVEPMVERPREERRPVVAGKKDQGPGTPRKSDDGRFTTKKYAETHPKTTEIEHNKKPKGK